MFVLRRLPACLALLMLGALALRLGLGFLVAGPLTLLLLVLLFIPRAVPQVIASAVVWGGSIAWVGMAGLRIQQRLGEGLPWLRLALIFGAVALFTAGAAWLLRGTTKEPSNQNQKIDQPVRVVKRSSASTPATPLPWGSRAGLHAQRMPRSGSTARMPPPTPLLPGSPTR